MKKFAILDFPKFAGESGELIPVELDKLIPFEVKRVYFLKEVPIGVKRGGHAHLIEKEVFVCIQGQCTALVDEDGNGKKKYILNNPTKAIFLDTNVWHEFMHFSPGAILLAFSSTNYLPGPQNYLDDYEKFCAMNSNI